MALWIIESIYQSVSQSNLRRPWRLTFWPQIKWLTRTCHVLSTCQVWWRYIQWLLFRVNTHTHTDTHTHMRTERINALLARRTSAWWTIMYWPRTFWRRCMCVHRMKSHAPISLGSHKSWKDRIDGCINHHKLPSTSTSTSTRNLKSKYKPSTTIT